MRLFILLAITLSWALGCTPRVIVKPNPGQHARGIRYYRPKPYLAVMPFEKTVATKKADDDDGGTPVAAGVSDQYVSIRMEYLPDFEEEYAIDVRSGLGVNNTKITLKDGWNLTQIDQELDSQPDENIEAVAKLLESAGQLATRPAMEYGGGQGTMVVRATNVPLGYYESVLGYSNGKKRLYGWRYVGFLPYAPCPLNAGGSQGVCCNQAELYGLVFDNGIMTFKPLYEVESIGLQGAYQYEAMPSEYVGPRAQSICELVAPNAEAIPSPKTSPTLELPNSAPERKGSK